MTSNSLLLCILGSLVALLSSCAPLVPYRQQAPLQAQAPDLPASATANTQEQKQIKKTRKKVASTPKPKPSSSEGEASSSVGNSGSTSASSGGAAANTPPTSQKPTYRYALQIPGKEGFVFNPFTNNPVDVRGIPSGTLVRDPQDSNPDHKFRVP